MRRSICTAALAVCVVAAAGPRAAVDDLAARAEALLSQPAEGIVQQAIPFFYSHFLDSRLTPLLADVWRGNREAHQGVNWQALQDPTVRISLAQLWGQWLRESKGDLAEVAAMREFVRPHLQDPNPSVRLAAAAFLGTLGTPKDVPQLEQMVLAEPRPVAVTSAFAIYGILGLKAGPVLRRLSSQVTDPGVKERIDFALAEIKRGRTRFGK